MNTIYSKRVNVFALLAHFWLLAAFSWVFAFFLFLFLSAFSTPACTLIQCNIVDRVFCIAMKTSFKGWVHESLINWFILFQSDLNLLKASRWILLLFDYLFYFVECFQIRLLNRSSNCFSFPTVVILDLIFSAFSFWFWKDYENLPACDLITVLSYKTP